MRVARLGIDISAEYVKRSEKRIATARAGSEPRTEIAENPEAQRVHRRSRAPSGARVSRASE